MSLLPDTEPAVPPAGGASGNGPSAFADPAFAVNKSRPVHRWVPWIAGFSGDFVRDALARHLREPGVVLDPFAGVGTTLVEAILAGHQAVGFEINPYAALACQTKLAAHQMSAADLAAEIARFSAFWEERAASAGVPRSRPPAGFRTRAAFYSPKVLAKVLTVQDFVETVADAGLRDLFRLAFASTMVRYSNYSYEPSLGRRVAAGREEIHDFPVFQTVLEKLHEMREDIAWLTIWLKERLPAGKPEFRVIRDSFLRCERHLAPASVDLLVTSPPYLNNYHYNRNTRPQLYWLGLAEQPEDLAELEQLNFGKFWQTVRELPLLDLEFELPGSDLAERLAGLRALHPERGVYGGNGWANYAASYFNDCRRFAQGIGYCLRPGGTALVVVGNSIIHGVLIPTDVYFGRIAESAGLELVAIHVPRSARVGNSITRSEVRAARAERPHQLYEAVVELRRR